MVSKYIIISGNEWGWKVGSANDKNPFICEINKRDVARIVDKMRGFGK